MSILYPYPSHVCAPSFVTVKLSGRNMYDLWRKQMLCLLESHDMFGFINGTLVSTPQGTDGYKLWKRSYALLQGWILGSLSEPLAMRVLQNLKFKQHQNMDVTAKDLWDQLQMMCHQQTDHHQSDPTKERVGGVRGSFHHQNLENKMNDEKDRAKKHEQLYLAAERGKWNKLVEIIDPSNVDITEKISLNGNTALHVAVASSTAEANFLNNMLNLLPEEKSLLEVRNSEGSTVLHTAAAVGRTHAAEILVNRCRQLLFEKDDEGQTPLDIVLSNPRSKKMCNYLLNEYKVSNKADLEQQGSNFADREEPLVTAISYGHLDLAKILIKEYDVLKTDAVLMAIVQHWPIGFSVCESVVYEMWEGPISNFVTRLTLDYHSSHVVHKSLMKFVKCLITTVFKWPFKVLVWICVYLKVFKTFKEKAERRSEAMELLDIVCGLIKFSTPESSYPHFYTEPVLEAIRRDECNVIENIVFWFPDASRILDEDGHNVAQACWKNRALKLLTLSVNADMSKHVTMLPKIGNDPFGNTFLHFAARLAPKAKLNLISGPPFVLQREFRWFKTAKELLPGSVMVKNCFGETPDMVFTREHKELLIEGGNWMKNTANAYVLTATLIITIVFAAAITVPGGNTEKDGFPRFEDNPIFVVFAASVVISMETATTSLLLFLSIMTSRFAEKDFKLKLPLTLVIGLLNLFISATFMILAFGAAWFLMFWKKHPWTIGWIALLMGQPVVFFFIYQSNLVIDLLTSVTQFTIAYFFTRIRGLGRVLV